MENFGRNLEIKPINNAEKSNRTGLRGYRCRQKQGTELWFVVADDHLIVDEDDWHAHLAAFFDHFRSLAGIGADVEFGVGDIVGLKKFLGHFAEFAIDRGVN
jgi:hypothetical protein